MEPFLHVDDDTARFNDEVRSACIVGPSLLATQDDILQSLTDAFARVVAFQESLQPFVAILQEMRSVTEDGLLAQHDAGQLSLDEVRNLLHKFEGYKEQMNELHVRCIPFPA